MTKRWKNEAMKEALSKLSLVVISFNEAHRKFQNQTLPRRFEELNKNVKF